VLEPAAAGQEFVGDLQDVMAFVIRRVPRHEAGRSEPGTDIEPIHNPIGLTLTNCAWGTLPGPGDTTRRGVAPT
jgi:hypothetical protein